MSLMIIPIGILFIVCVVLTVKLLIKDNPVGFFPLFVAAGCFAWGAASISIPREVVLDEMVPIKTLVVVEGKQGIEKFSYQVVEYLVDGHKYSHRPDARIIYSDDQKFRVRIYRDGWYNGMYWFFDHKIEPYYASPEQVEVGNESIGTDRNSEKEV
jgi:hypothetical protein